jgi:hypothetical protein
MMSNLTISVSSDVLKRARLRALEEDTSVNAVLAAYLEAYSGADDHRRRRERAVAHILDLSEKSAAGSGGRSWSRDELHER